MVSKCRSGRQSSDASWRPDLLGPLGTQRMAFSREVTKPGLKQRRFSGISTSAGRDVANRLSLDSGETLTPRTSGRVFYDLALARKWTGRCKSDSNKREVGQRWTRLTFFYANSSQVGQCDVTGEICTKWNERESTWRKSGSCQSRGTSQSKS